jgi:predicted phage tail protein
VNTAVPPSAPAYLQAVVDGTRVTLAWRNTYGGGAPTSLELDVTGSATVQLPLGLGDTFTFTDVPPGRYTLTLRARNASGVSSASNAVSLSVPGPCSGPPATPVWVFAYLASGTVHVAWQPGVSGPAPAAYVVIVTGGWTGALVTTVRETSGVLGAGAYTLSLVAVNSCGASGASPPRTVMVP